MQRVLAAGFGRLLLLSHDTDWFDPAKPGGGTPSPYTYLNTGFPPKLDLAGVDIATIHHLTEDNPFDAYPRNGSSGLTVCGRVLGAHRGWGREFTVISRSRAITLDCDVETGEISRKSPANMRQKGNAISLDRLYILTGFVWLIIGMVFGIYIGITDQTTQSNAHAHANLLGFVISVLFGLKYRIWPNMTTSRLRLI